jgi:type II secretory pathway pseudopilin PulG
MINQKGFGHIAAIVTIALIAIAMTTVMFWFSMEVDRRNSATSIVTTNSFEECIAAGFPAMESQPRQCNDGTKTFIEALSDSTSLAEEAISTDTNDWLDYVNTPYGYSFHRPAEFIADSTNEAGGVTFTNSEQGIITVSVVREPYNVDSLIAGTEEFTDVAPITVGNVDGYTYSYSDAGCGFGYIKVPHSEATVYISFTSCLGTTQPINLDKALQKSILDTFEFDPSTIITQ